MKRLLAENGNIMVHADYNIGPYVRLLMDEVFGSENLVNEIAWKRQTAHSDPSRCGAIHDTILWYQKSEKKIFNSLYTEYDEAYIKSHYRYTDESGRKYRRGDLGAPHGQGPVYEWHGITRPWRFTKENMMTLEKENRILYTKHGIPEYKRYLDEMPGVPLQDLWTDINPVNSQAKENTGFETQKPLELMERIINMCSNESDLVADFFIGSGTTLVAAERLKRKWIGCDFSKTAVQIARNRLVDSDSQPFLVENIGNYQRHLVYLSGARIYEMQTIVLKLYGATPRKDQPDLGVRNAEDGIIELVYVGYPDRPITARKTVELALLADTLDGTGYKRVVILGWDYEYNYDDLLREEQKRREKFTVEILSKSIPPEVYDYLKKAKSEEDLEPLRGKIFFHSKPYLKLAKPKFHKTSKREISVNVGIERYVLFDYPIEGEEQRIELQDIVKKSFASLIDYWAVDWNYDGITFKSVWQAFRGFGDRIREVPLSTSQVLETDPPKHTIAVRVVDIFGNDATAYVDLDLRKV